MQYSPICCDANLIIRLVTGTSQAIIDLWEEWDRQNLTLVAPQLMRYELTNAFFGHYVRDGNTLEECRFFLDTALSLPITIDDDIQFHQRAMTLADRFGLRATYDAHYLAAAEKHSATLWTCDAKMFEHVEGKLAWVRLIR